MKLKEIIVESLRENVLKGLHVPPLSTKVLDTLFDQALENQSKLSSYYRDEIDYQSIWEDYDIDEYSATNSDLIQNAEDTWGEIERIIEKLEEPIPNETPAQLAARKQKILKLKARQDKIDSETPEEEWSVTLEIMGQPRLLRANSAENLAELMFETWEKEAIMKNRLLAQQIKQAYDNVPAMTQYILSDPENAVSYLCAFKFLSHEDVGYGFTDDSLESRVDSGSVGNFFDLAKIRMAYSNAAEKLKKENKELPWVGDYSEEVLGVKADDEDEDEDDDYFMRWHLRGGD